MGWDPIKTVTSVIGEIDKKIIDPMEDVFDESGNLIATGGKFIDDAFDPVQAYTDKVWKETQTGLRKGAKVVTVGIETGIDQTLKGIKTVGEETGKFITDTGNTVIDGIKDAANGVGDAFEDFANWWKKMFQDVTDFFNPLQWSWTTWVLIGGSLFIGAYLIFGTARSSIVYTPVAVDALGNTVQYAASVNPTAAAGVGAYQIARSAI